MVYNAYRAVVYYKLAGAPDDATRVEAESYRTAAQAYACLEALMGLQQGAVGHLDVEVPGVGWVREEDAETVVHQHRLRQSDREFNEANYNV
jgi:hypothetical protein